MYVERVHECELDFHHLGSERQRERNGWAERRRQFGRAACRRRERRGPELHGDAGGRPDIRTRTHASTDAAVVTGPVTRATAAVTSAAGTGTVTNATLTAAITSAAATGAITSTATTVSATVAAAIWRRRISGV
jgi:hypothetical protein